MTSQESINNEVQIRLASHDEKFNAIMARIDATNEKVDNFILEMRDRDNRRAAENAEIRNSIKEIYTTTDAKIEKIENKIDGMINHIQILSLTAMGGIIAAGVGIAAMVWTVINK